MTFGRNEACCGCNACRESCPRAAITMMPNEKGFLEPKIDFEKCTSCKICEKVCPLNSKANTITTQELFACKIKPESKRAQSQSGGAFTGIAEYVLMQKGVVYGVTLDENLNAIYDRITNIKRLSKIKGSKYVQVDIQDTFSKVKKDLHNGLRVLFSGTPCHVHGLYSFLKNSATDLSKLITVDIVCHGVPSPMVYRDYLSLFERKHNNKKVTHFDFRDKSFGWHGHTIAIYSKNRTFINNDYVDIFYSHLALRDSCYACKYTNFNRVGDITICDCWGIENIAPEFDDDKGCSLVIINNEVGADIWTKIKGNFECISVLQEQILQPNMQHPTEKPKETSDFWQDYKRYNLEYVMYKYCGCKFNTEYELIKNNEILKRIRRKLCYYFER